MKAIPPEVWSAWRRMVLEAAERGLALESSSATAETNLAPGDRVEYIARLELRFGRGVLPRISCLTAPSEQE